MTDIAEPHRRAVIRLALTAATGSRHDAVMGEFQDFVRTVRPGTGTEA